MIQASRRPRNPAERNYCWRARIVPALIECHQRGFRVVYRVTPLVGSAHSRLQEAYVSGDVARGRLVVGRSVLARFKGDRITEVTT